MSRGFRVRQALFVIVGLTLAASCFRDPGLEGDKLKCWTDDNCLAGFRCSRTPENQTSDPGFCYRGDGAIDRPAAIDVAGNESAPTSDGATVDRTKASDTAADALAVDSQIDQVLPQMDAQEDAPTPSNDGPAPAADATTTDTPLPTSDSADAPITSTGGTSGKGGSTGLGGSTSTGGTVVSGGTSATGGTVGLGGTSATSGAGGSATAGGTSDTGGASTGGGTTGSAGMSATGGESSIGGTSASGGTSGTGGATVPMTGPCDIYQAGNTPCAAAHSTVRALYGAYTGVLYQVQRASDGTTKDILVGAGGFANTAVQETFCANTTCTIPIIYDQSPNRNHLRVTWFAYWLRNGGTPADAYGQKIFIGGHPVYGIKSPGPSSKVAYRTGVPLSGTASITKDSATVTFSLSQTLPANTVLLFAANTKDCPDGSWPQDCNLHAYFTAAAINNSTTVTLTEAYTGTSDTATAVWNHTTKGVATGEAPEGIYAVLDANNYNQWCCYNYGNAQMTGIDEGNGTAEALYFGSDTQFGQSGGGNGPWVAADLENGMYECDTGRCPAVSSITGMSYLTGMLKGKLGNMVLKAGNAQSGALETKWDGNRPPAYGTMHKQGAIVLASGGDGSTSGAGTWFEGAITTGFPSDETDNAVQANIVAAGYGK